MGTENMIFPALPVNHDAFRVIDTPQKAYVVGMLLADGCVLDARPGYSRARVNLRILARDIKVCKMIQELAGGNLRLIEKGYRAEWCLNSDAIATDLIDLGVTPRKSLTAVLHWDRIPEALHGAALAGLIDGDGHLRFDQAKRRAEISLVTASAALRDQLLDRFPWFKLYVAPVCRYRRRPHYTVIADNNRERLGGLINYVYDSLPFQIIDRKAAVLAKLRDHLAGQEEYQQGMRQVTSMKASGMTIQQIADELGTSRRPIMARLKAAGVCSQVVVFTDEDRCEMQRMATDGLSVLQVYRAIGKGTEQAVRYHLQKMGCIARRESPASRERHPDARAILASFQRGKTANAIASERGMDARVVCRVLRQEGITLHGGSAQKLTDDQVRWAVEQLGQGRTLRSVASDLGVSETLIRIRKKQLAEKQVERIAGAAAIGSAGCAPGRG